MKALHRRARRATQLAAWAGGAHTRPKVRRIPTPSPRGRTHAVCCRPPVGGLAVSAPPALSQGSGGRWTHGAKTGLPDERIAVRTERLSCPRGRRAWTRAAQTPAHPPLPPHRHADGHQLAAGGRPRDTVAAAESSRRWRAGGCGTHSAKDVLGRSPPHTSGRVLACHATPVAVKAAAAEARGHWSAAALPPRPREARALLPRGRWWAASWLLRLPALAVCAGGRRAGAFAALIGCIGCMATVTETADRSITKRLYNL